MQDYLCTTVTTLLFLTFSAEAQVFSIRPQITLRGSDSNSNLIYWRGGVLQKYHAFLELDKNIFFRKAHT
jgi:hypothetical protein